MILMSFLMMTYDLIGKIENELVKIDVSWRENFLVVVKYKKDGQERGFILRAAEDLKLGI